MRYTGTTKARGNGEQVWEFVFGKEELRVLGSILDHYKKAIPLTLETQSLRYRVGTMLKEVRAVLKTGKGRNPEGPTPVHPRGV